MIKKSIHRRLQEKLLLVTNTIIFIGAIILSLVSFFNNQPKPTLIGTAVATIIFVSYIFLFFRKYNSAVHITIGTLITASFAALITRESQTTTDLLYLFVSYQSVAIIIAGLLADKKIFPILTGIIALGLLSYYLGAVHKHDLTGQLMPVFGSYAIVIVLTTLSTQIFELTGSIMDRFNKEAEASARKDQLLQDIISIYQNSTFNGEQLEGSVGDNNNFAAELSDTIQKFTEDMHELDQLIKDSQLRYDDTAHSTSQIFEIFQKHKDNMIKYEDKINTISENSQEIDLIIQNKKVQITELIELSEKGGVSMQESVVAVEKVAENSKSMVDMISLIMEVAEKTNILALNAAVEASRAGKYGGGFAIVAKEIKSLSTETTQNADTINRSLKNNIKSISEATEIIRNVSSSFEVLSTNIVDFASAIDHMIINIKNLSHQNSQISLDTKNTLSIIGEVQNSLEKIINTINKGKHKVSDIQTLSGTIKKDLLQVHQKTSSVTDMGRKIQEKYREYTYSVKKVENIVTDIATQLQLTNADSVIKK